MQNQSLPVLSLSNAVPSAKDTAVWCVAVAGVLGWFCNKSPVKTTSVKNYQLVELISVVNKKTYSTPSLLKCYMPMTVK